MKKNDAVFQLIKSLTRGEKRNFRMLAQLTSGDKKYLQLFDTLDGLQEYDEVKILKKFRKDPSFEKQFAYNKNYLYNSILNSLAYFHKGADSELSALTIQVKILSEKSLFYQAKKLLRKAKEKVILQERFEELLKLLNLEIEVLIRTENIKVLRDSLRNVEFEERLTLEKIENLIGYRKLKTRVLILRKTFYMARTDNELKLLEEVTSSDLLEGDHKALSTRAKFLFHEVMENIYTYKGDEQKALDHAKQALQILEAVPEILKEQQKDYLMLLSSLMRHQLVVHGKDEAFPTLMKIRDVKPQTPFERLFRFAKFYNLYVLFHLDTGERIPEEIIEEMMKEMKALKNDLSDNVKLSNFYSLAVYYFYQTEFNTALEWINKFLNHRKSEARSDLQVMARLMNMLIHYELGNYDLIEYNIKSTYRYAYKKEKLNRYERSLLSFLRKAINVTNQTELKVELKMFRKELVEIFQDKLERRADDYFKNFEWIDSKLTGRPVLELIQESCARGLKNNPELDGAEEKSTSKELVNKKEFKPENN